MIRAIRLFALLILMGLSPISHGASCSDARSPELLDSTSFYRSTLSFPSGNLLDTLMLDLYLPAFEVAEGWGILFMHGGGFSAGKRDDPINIRYCEALAAKGIAVASMDYRLRQVGKGFHCNIPVADKREAIRWAGEDLEQALDALNETFPNGSIVCGTSAGAEAALFAAFHLQLEDIRGVISIGGAMERVDSFAPIPVLAYHGTCDELVPFCQAIHHYCPESSPGALHLIGSGAIADLHPLVKLTAIHSAGHEITSNLLMEPAFIHANVDFIWALKTHNFRPALHEIHLSSTCDSLPTSSLPCPSH